MTNEEIHHDFVKIQEQWDSIRTRFFWTVFTSLGAFVAIGIWVGTIQAEVGHNTEEISEHKIQYTQVDSRIVSLEVNNSEIKARLASIEAILLEIKADLVKLR